VIKLDARTTGFVTGHRPPKIGGYYRNSPLRLAVYNAMRQAVHTAIGMGYVTWMSGMAQGADQDCADIVLEARERDKLPVRLIAVVPFEGQEKVWPPAAQRHYHGILERADETVILHRKHLTGEFNRHEVVGFLNERNRWMADRGGMCVAVFDGTTGGTFNCVQYAHEVGCKFIYINPELVQQPGYVPEVI
jgi:uncharacterized phage-like protein YoqJ